MVIVGIAAPQSHPKVPEVEQLMSAAVGMSFLGLALRDAGYGAMWRTGGVAYHPEVLEGLGLEPGSRLLVSCIPERCLLKNRLCRALRPRLL